MLTLWNGYDRSLGPELRQMDRLFGELAPRVAAPRTAGWPCVNVVESDEAILVQAEVPGFKPDQVKVTMHDGELKLEGHAEETSEKQDEHGSKILLKERRDLSFQRTFRLDVDIDESKISAAIKDGVLTVTLPKAEPVKPRQIDVLAK